MHINVHLTHTPARSVVMSMVTSTAASTTDHWSVTTDHWSVGHLQHSEGVDNSNKRYDQVAVKDVSSLQMDGAAACKGRQMAA